MMANYGFVFLLAAFVGWFVRGVLEGFLDAQETQPTKPTEVTPRMIIEELRMHARVCSEQSEREFVVRWLRARAGRCRMAGDEQTAAFLDSHAGLIERCEHHNAVEP